MKIPWPDFFRPDAHSSNRALKKFLQSEGLEFGHRDIVLIRQLAQKPIYLSYALLECWTEGELEKKELERLSDLDEGSGELREFCTEFGLSHHVTGEGVVLVGLEGELTTTELEGEDTSLVHQPSFESDASPLMAVYGPTSLSAQPGAGGVWDEDHLQSESVILLDGESPKELVEAFRHLFRAAPNGTARASVVAAALARHREELNQEVALKLEEIAPAFGQAMRQLFCSDADQGKRALQFLLKTEIEVEPPAWSRFWSQIRPTILESLARHKRGSEILIQSIDHLAATTTGDKFLNHQLLETFLNRLEELSPGQQEKLINFVVEWALEVPATVGILRSLLNLKVEKNQRLLLGESLRRVYTRSEDQESLRELARVYVSEAISAGSTAGSLALAELLRSFGALVLEESVVGDTDLQALTERQMLNLTGIWELMATDDEALVPRVRELYLDALRSVPDHLSLLLKSRLLQLQSIHEGFLRWLESLSESERRQIVSVGYSWSLTVENRALVAEALSDTEWGFEELWNGEWRRAQLSYQRLGWLAECAEPDGISFSCDLEERVLGLLKSPPTHLYFWNLMLACTQFSSFRVELREKLFEAAGATFSRLESTQDEEREFLFAVGAGTVAHHPRPTELNEEWPQKFREGRVDQVWWLSGVVEELYSPRWSAPPPDRVLITAIIHRLLSTGEQSMKDLLKQALAADDEEGETTIAFLPLEVSNLAYEALASLSDHPSCEEATQQLIRRRLVLFLISWSEELRKTDDPYSFRETPLFAIVEGYLEDPNPQLQELITEAVQRFLDLHRKVPDKFRLEVRHTAQSFFRKWAEAHPQTEAAESWRRSLQGFFEVPA